MGEQTAVIIGAGNVGRGFIGQVLHDSGYKLVFVDVDEALVARLREEGRYKLTLTDGETSQTCLIDGVSAIDGRDSVQVAQALAGCALAATAVGKNALPHVAPSLVLGIKARYQLRPQSPLNILICENISDARASLYALLKPHFSAAELPMLNGTGLVETTIGRMVPLPTPAMKAQDPTAVLTEPYCELPLDDTAFRGARPFIRYTVSFEPFAYFTEQKLYIHNMGHALCAYLGAALGYDTIWQAIGDARIAGPVRAAMTRLADAIARAYRADPAAPRALADSLMRRFGNRLLGDTIARVGQDPLRKLAPGDRFMGAIARCQSQNLPYQELLLGIAMALRFDQPGDPSSGLMRERLDREGAEGFVASYCGLSTTDSREVARIYNNREAK